MEVTGDDRAERSTPRARPPLVVLVWLAVVQLTLAAAQPAPRLFPETAWGDEEPYLADLLPSFRGAAQLIDQRPVYHLDWRLEALDLLSARMEVRLVNDSADDWRQLYFHLLPNLLGGDLTIASVELDGKIADWGLERDGALLAIELPAPLQSGRAVVVSVDYRLRIPVTARRNYGVLALRHDTLSLAHAYPMLAVYRSGWDLDPPPEHGDLVHARAGFYRARVTAPRDAQLVTTGAAVSRAVEGENQVVEVVAGPVRDFYLAAAPDLTAFELSHDEITVRGHAPDCCRAGMEQAVRWAVDAVAFLEELVGPYPYRELDLVVITTSALGIEFPGAIALRRQLFESEEQASLLESTVVHEVVHQWFYGVVGNDQVSDPWLDESLTQYLTLRYYLSRHGASGYRSFRAGLLSRWDQVNRRTLPVGLPVAAYDEGEYGAIVYGLGALVFEWLADQLGRPNFDEFLSGYYQKHLFDIAYPGDVRAAAEETCDCALGDFFATWIERGSGITRP